MWDITRLISFRNSFFGGIDSALQTPSAESVVALPDCRELWPFEPGWTRKQVFEFLDISGLAKEEFYTRHFTQRASDDGKIEVVEAREK